MAVVNGDTAASSTDTTVINGSTAGASIVNGNATSLSHSQSMHISTTTLTNPTPIDQLTVAQLKGKLRLYELAASDNKVVLKE